MHLVHVVRDLELTSGGPSRSIPQLVLALDQFCREDSRWHQSVVFLDRGRPNADFPGGSDRLSILPVSKSSLAHAVESLHSSRAISLMHVHGLWNLSAHRVIQWARRRPVPYVISPRGMLSEWCFNHKRWKKEIGWRLYQHRDLARAAAIHATSSDELNDIRRMQLQTPVEVIPNGSELSTIERLPSTRVVRNALCLTRLHPVKGTDMLLEIWAKLRPVNWQLTIAGPSEAGMRERLIELIARHHLSDTVRLLGEANGQAKQELFEQADLFVLPSKSENFGMVIAEALSSGLPVVTTTGTPWAHIPSHGCGWIAAPETAPFTSVLAEALACDAHTLHIMGKLGRKLIAEKYAWQAVASRMYPFYFSLLLSRR